MQGLRCTRSYNLRGVTEESPYHAAAWCCEPLVLYNTWYSIVCNLSQHCYEASATHGLRIRSDALRQDSFVNLANQKATMLVLSCARQYCVVHCKSKPQGLDYVAVSV